ncbi:MAG TPA: phosphatidylglycerophosphatase A [Proteobacteria bacterium]|nr:phosphatidylglycerophosphatase A [bacterium BMS3Abin14]HDL52364.1 phosphatidylglycerophosphatase A [Pseudomonadota bacterium]
MKDTLVRILATGLGAGYFPVASGTAGTVAAIPLFLLLAQLWGSAGVIAGAVAAALVGIPVSSRMEILLGVKDPKPVVIDEIAGYLVTMAGSPPDILHITAGFFLFRFFDVTKLQPARWLEITLPGGYGIVADDIMAGLFAWGALRVMEWMLL